MPPFALQKTVFCSAIDGILECERRPFIERNVASRDAARHVAWSVSFRFKCYFVINATAYALIPSSRPVKPSRSVVVALIDIWSSSTPITSARQAFMAGT
ncbi:unknown [Prevotella sp. CAG:1124]|nr:unknown [Prevotella sp. CAG:1124]